MESSGRRGVRTMITTSVVPRKFQRGEFRINVEVYIML